MSSVRIYNHLYLCPNRIVGVVFSPLTALIMMSFAEERYTQSSLSLYFNILGELLYNHAQNVISNDVPEVATRANNAPANLVADNDFPLQRGERSEGMSGVSLRM